jgi:hypothetical protein
MPLQWLLLSFAAWRALFQLLYAPQRWEKTEHGLPRTSRVASSQRSLPERRRNRIEVGPLKVPYKGPDRGAPGDRAVAAYADGAAGIAGERHI